MLEIEELTWLGACGERTPVLTAASGTEWGSLTSGGDVSGREGALEVVNPDNRFWTGRRVLITGHTGFKGAWLWLLLHYLGSKPAGAALAPNTAPSLSVLTGIAASEGSHTVDICDATALDGMVRAHEPEIVFHLAAQPLVSESYRQPALTFTTNVMGTINLLESLRRLPSVRSVVIVTSDKVYRNPGKPEGNSETDALGGHDPYSSSKACAEFAVDSWRLSFFEIERPEIGIATVRSGNVIGGGDWANDRLIPDLVRSFVAGVPARLRQPSAARSWIHVLEPLVGYLLLAERLWREPKSFSQAWNFGPDPGQACPVETIARRAIELWGAPVAWQLSPDHAFHEAAALNLNSTKAESVLGWKLRLNLEEALRWTIQWYREWNSGAPVNSLCRDQIERYLSMTGSPDVAALSTLRYR